MYKIIGGDQKEYGPISADQIRQWITEGRLNAHTKAQAEGSPDWKPLSEFLEFAEALGRATRPPPTPAPFPAAGAGPTPGAFGGREEALRAVNGPAIALMVTAILGFIVVILGLLMNTLTIGGLRMGMREMPNPEMQQFINMFSGTMGIVSDIVGAVIGVIVLIGALKMRALQNYQLAFAASILAMLPCLSPCCILGLPFGIWALVVLNKPEIKSQFT